MSDQIDYKDPAQVADWLAKNDMLSLDAIFSLKNEVDGLTKENVELDQKYLNWMGIANGFDWDRQFQHDRVDKCRAALLKILENCSRRVSDIALDALQATAQEQLSSPKEKK